MVDFPDGYLPISFAHQYAPYMSSINAIGNTVFVDLTDVTLSAGTTGVVLSLTGKGSLRKLDCIIKAQSGTSLETLKDVVVYTEIDGSGLYGMDLETLFGLALTSYSQGRIVLTRFDDFTMQYGVGIYRQVRFDENFKFALKNPYDEDIIVQLLSEYEILL